MLITSYGIDCALAQIVYYHNTTKTNFATISNKVINRYLTKHNPKILVGLRPSIENVTESMVLIDNTKKGLDMFSDLPNFVYEPKVSKTHILSKYLKVDAPLYRYAMLADALTTGQYTDNNVVFLDFYNAVGHDTFVYKFLIDDSLVLNKNDQQLALRFRKFQNDTADSFVQEFMVKQDGIAVCRANYNMKEAIENAILEKYREDLCLIVTWDYNNDDTIRINLCSKSDLAGKIADKMDGDNYIRSGSYKITYNDEEEDLSSYIMEQIVEVYESVVNERQQQMYEEKQREIEEYKKTQSEDLLDYFN